MPWGGDGQRAASGNKGLPSAWEEVLARGMWATGQKGPLPAHERCVPMALEVRLGPLMCSLLC